MIPTIMVNFDEVITEVKNGIPGHSTVKKIGKKFFRGGSPELYVVVPYWHAKMSSLAMRILKRRILKKGHSCLEYQFPEKILSDDVRLTVKYFKEIQAEIKRDIEAIKNKYDFKKVTAIGMSLGGASALMVANKNPDIDSVILVVPGDSLADSLWRGIETVKLKNEIKARRIDLGELERDWKDIEPKNNICGLAGKNIEVWASRSDKVIPYRDGNGLVKDMKDIGLTPLVLKNKILGHYLTILKFVLSKRF